MYSVHCTYSTNKIKAIIAAIFSWNFSYMKFIVIIHLLLNFNDKAIIHVEAKLLCCHPVQKFFCTPGKFFSFDKIKGLFFFLT